MDYYLTESDRVGMVILHKKHAHNLFSMAVLLMLVTILVNMVHYRKLKV